MSPTQTKAPAAATPIRGLIPPLLLGVLALVSAAEPMSINMYLAGLPQLGREFGIDQAAAQLTITFFLAGMAIGQHGSWNRSKLSGYKLAFVEFQNGKPVGMPREILSGFLSPDEKYSYGRPVGVAIAADGAVLMADDVGDVIWRVTGASAKL